MLRLSLLLVGVNKCIPMGILSNIREVTMGMEDITAMEEGVTTVVDITATITHHITITRAIRDTRMRIMPLVVLQVSIL